jgi:hypothetical protein
VNLEREIYAALRRVGIALGLVSVMLAIFWLIFWALS